MNEGKPLELGRPKLLRIIAGVGLQSPVLKAGRCKLALSNPR